MAKFFPLKVKDIYKDTDDCSVVTFDIPEDLKPDFKYHQGQHLTLKKYINGEDIRRSYSLCSSPVDDEWKVAVKQIYEGKFSTYVNQDLKANDILEVMPPSGDFGVDIQQDTNKTYLFFAAGSGITPILSMIKTHLAKEPEANCKLFYLNKNAKSIIFKEEIEQIRNRYFGRFEIFYFLTREQRDIDLLNGRFTPEKIQLLANTVFDIDEVSDVFVCGPEQMIFMIRDELISLGLTKNSIHYELFVSGLTEEDKKRTEQALAKLNEGTQITILDAGKEFHFAMTKDYDNLLDVALAAGADLPFACKGGVCSTCKCRVMEGNVVMKVNYALEKDEVEKNLVLSCQAVPTSEKLIVDFDV